MNFDLARLAVVATIARHGTMKGAAEELAYTPSAVSQQIHRLEAELGTKVVERHPRGVSLTEAGERIVAASESVQSELVALQNDLDDLAGARTGTLRLGVFPTFAASILPEVIFAYRERHPGVELIIRSSRQAPLRSLLDARELDMLLIWDYPWNRVVDDKLRVQSLIADPTVLVLPRSHRLASHTVVEIGELAAEAWVVREPGHPTREVIRRSAERAGFSAEFRVEANDYPEVQAMVAAGFGITMCPKLATQPLRDDLVVRALEPSVPARRIRTAHLAERTPSPAYAAMLDTMREVCERILR